jgi:hypothetical protein
VGFGIAEDLMKLGRVLGPERPQLQFAGHDQWRHAGSRRTFEVIIHRTLLAEWPGWRDRLEVTGVVRDGGCCPGLGLGEDGGGEGEVGDLVTEVSDLGALRA